jgi:general secretion pathway protein D
MVNGGWGHGAVAANAKVDTNHKSRQLVSDPLKVIRMCSRRRWLGTAWTGLALIVLSPVLGGCLTANDGSSTRSPAVSDVDVVSQVREVDLRAHFPQRGKPVEAVGSDKTAQPELFYGTGEPGLANPPAAPADRTASIDDFTYGRDVHEQMVTGSVTSAAPTSDDAKGYEMNFENTPVATVAKVVLGDILHLGYTIDPKVQASVTLASGGPVPRKDMLYVLESALRASNVALQREGTGYRLIPTAEAVGSGSVDTAQGVAPGFGITVVPLQFVSVTTLTKLLDNFAAKPGMVRADASRNLVVIQGNAADRQAALETVRDFDADWMRGQSVGIFPVSNSAPEPVIANLEKVIDSGQGGLSDGLVKLQSIPRQNAILAITRKPALLERIATWVARLDKAGAAGTRVRVYRMRYGDAREVAKLLNEMFTGSSDSALESPTNDLAPGSGALTSSSGEPSGFSTGGAQVRSGPNASFGGAQPGSSAGSTGQLAANSSLTNPFRPRFGSQSQTRSFSSAASPESGGPPILPGVRIAADATNNSLLIYANLENYRIIETTLNELDRPQLQVAIDATIAEVTLNDQLNYGVQFFLQNKNILNGNLAVSNSPIVNQNPLPAASTLAGAASTALTQALPNYVLPGFNFLVGSQASPQAILDALHAVTSVKVLSSPSLVVVDNQPATLVVGDQIPITTQTAISVQTAGAPIVSNVDYRNTGVILHVIPRINVNGNVLLNIQQEISNVADNGNATSLTPTVSQRVVKSSIAVASGQTVLLAGLISENQNHNANGVPGLDQVPGLGILFSHNNNSIARDELIIFIRPQIIRSGVDARRIAEEMRNKLIGAAGRVSVKAAPCCTK